MSHAQKRCCFKMPPPVLLRRRSDVLPSSGRTLDAFRPPLPCKCILKRILLYKKKSAFVKLFSLAISYVFLSFPGKLFLHLQKQPCLLLWQSCRPVSFLRLTKACVHRDPASPFSSIHSSYGALCLPFLPGSLLHL